jgi:hypothetical protein
MTETTPSTTTTPANCRHDAGSSGIAMRTKP